jgi:hypothetical protein
LIYIKPSDFPRVACCEKCHRLAEAEMPWSTGLRFTDPLPCQVAIQGSDIEVFPTTRGRFDSEITKIRFDRLWMQRFHSSLPQVIKVVHKPDRQAISFLTETKSPRLQYCGVDVLPGDVIVNRNEIIHKSIRIFEMAQCLCPPTI